jgi:hypothetical protein
LTRFLYQCGVEKGWFDLAKANLCWAQSKTCHVDRLEKWSPMARPSDVGLHMYAVSSVDVRMDRPWGEAVTGRVLVVILRYTLACTAAIKCHNFRTGNVFLHMACMLFSSLSSHSACSLLATSHMELGVGASICLYHMWPNYAPAIRGIPGRPGTCSKRDDLGRRRERNGHMVKVPSY